MFSEYNPYDKLEELETKLDLAHQTLSELSRINQELAVFTHQISASIHMLHHKLEYMNQRLQRLEKEQKDGKTKISTTATISGPE